MMAMCSVEDCPRSVRRKGLCDMHYKRWRRHGTTANPRPSTEQRFWEKVDKDGPVPEHRPELGPCWLWTGGFSSSAYGSFRVSPTRQTTAHRVAYELSKGTIGDGLEIDHLCLNTACVNPAHLEAVTPRENVLRGSAPSARNLRKTHCPQGHPYDAENTWWSRGNRRCRTCTNNRSREYQRRRRTSAA